RSRRSLPCGAAWCLPAGGAEQGPGFILKLHGLAFNQFRFATQSNGPRIMKASAVAPLQGQDNAPPRAADMPRSLVWLFAVASGLSVANVYYAQPLLDALARDFGISHAAVGGVVTSTQVGCALALLLLVPLG